MLLLLLVRNFDGLDDIHQKIVHDVYNLFLVSFAFRKLEFLEVVISTGLINDDRNYDERLTASRRSRYGF